MLAKFDITIYLNLHSLVPHTRRNKLSFLGKQRYGKIPPTFPASVKITTPPPSGEWGRGVVVVENIMIPKKLVFLQIYLTKSFS